MSEGTEGKESWQSHSLISGLTEGVNMGVAGKETEN